MQCPACSHVAAEPEFGQPAKCPQCGAFYEKALIARAKKAELLYQEAERAERKRKVDAAVRPARKVAGTSWRVLAAFTRSQLFGASVLIAAVTAGAVLLVTRDGERPIQPAKASPAPPSEYVVIRVGQRSVESRLKDADSAKFRNQFVGKSGVPCGEVNAKNGFSAYNGFKRYIASGGGVSVVEGEMPGAEFEEAWSRLCSK